MKIDYPALFKEIKALRTTARLKNEHHHNSYLYLELARKLDDLFGTARFLHYELCVEKYRENATRDYDVNTGKTLAKLALFAKMDMQRILEGYYRDYLEENGGL